ncbi:MAG: glycerophosphodiester phosphodiesterase family protein [Pseudomonadota bacterium]|nr:glycerophosphodiester phosphodiesterase family protein [Pseudomonadota bacterium]
MTIWIGHRGYRDKHSENTFGAFDAAVEHGFQMIETDLRTTADDHIILYHDPDLEKLGGSRHACIEQITRQEAKKMRYACGGEPVFLDEFINRYRSCRWVFDIKSRSGWQTLKVLKSRFDLSSIANNSIFLFDKFIHERTMRKIMPQAKFFARKLECMVIGIAILFHLPVPRFLTSGKTFGVPPRLAGVPIYSASLVERFHRRGAKVIGYLPRDVADTRMALDAGVDLILTDYSII